MSFSINTNVASLQAQNNLLKSTSFQSQTIGEVTSGLRIVNSGDDAAGLAVANGLASDQAVLNQGIQNAQQGLNSLQTIDGGMSNINTLLDRAQTLATESASGTFTGNRSTLNSEFQSVMGEINRQAQSIQMNSGGTLASSLSVYIGGGQASGTITANTNASVGVDLSKASVDTTSLGLTGYSAGYSGNPPVNSASAGLYDLGNASTTSVKAILADGTNTASEASAGYTQFTVSGAGFSDSTSTGSGAITLNVNLSGVSDTTSLVTAINSAIQAAGTAPTASANAFAASGITAGISTDSAGHQQLQFTSPHSAFSVAAGTDLVANAFLGNLTGQTDAGDGAASSALGIATTNAVFTANGSNQVSDAWVTGAAAAQTLTFSATTPSGTTQTTTVTLTAAENTTLAGTGGALETINNQLQATDKSALQGIVAVSNAAGTGIVLQSTGAFSVTPGVTTATKGIEETAQGQIQTSASAGTGANSDISTVGGATAAITALNAAVQYFGTAQAAVGRGENDLNYAINLAQSESTNEASSESTIKDANLAMEAANLSKAQILTQAGVAALAQANSAPQTLLKLLQ